MKRRRNCMPTDPIPRTMQAVVYRGVNDLCVETVPAPRCGAQGPGGGRLRGVSDR